MLRDDSMPVYEAPDDPGDNDDGSQGGGGGEEGEGGEGGAGYNGPRQSYNFAPSYRGIVYRADVPDWGAGPRSRRDGQTSRDTEDLMPSPPDAPNTGEHIKNADEQQTSTQIESKDVHYKLQAMKWGLIPFWTKRNPGYGSVMKTINCRDDSLAHGGGMWSSMKARKRCIVIAQGFYEWLKKDGGREKMPHYIKRKDGKLMCLAGLWDVVQYESKCENP
jgi:putative SOS response-associated peptidase YedK